ncbi:hypothetical protein Slin15195_G130350 [Septoria linicola]|uniref:Uncharacterized protein n=1 Tax=Septoria linicola TaxID=215465 RepID=A0A9Q9EQE0_9PEZI|nr:hypothetical protein Slin15195_G130350 [Septoria linicola]
MDTAFAKACYSDHPYSKEPILEDQYLTHAITGNLTVGFYSSFGKASDCCSCRLNFTTDARGIDLRAKLQMAV